MRTALTRAFRVLADCLGASTFGTIAGAAATADMAGAGRAGGRIAAKSKRSQSAIFEPLEGRTLMSTTFYVSPTGSDNNSGTSESSPWKTTGKVSSYHFTPGEQVLFEGGKSFSGSLKFFGDGGSSSDPVVVGSYGSGKATLDSGTGIGLWALNTTGLTIKDLNFVGTPGSTATQDGIRIENYTGGGVRSGFTVTGCSVSGYAEHGIDFGSDAANEGLNDVSITDNNVFDNIEAGIQSWSVTTESNTNVLIASNLVHNNYGDGTNPHSTGNGICLQGLNGATIEYNSAYDNGQHGYGVGIWCYISNDVLMQYNQSYDNYTINGEDGDGFDFDYDTSNSIMQYNLAYNNDGGGFMLDQFENDNVETGDVIRYNIAQDNGRKNNYGNIEVWGKVLNAQIYNNTCYDDPAQSGTNSDIRFSNNEINNLFASNVKVANNIFVSTGGVPLVDMYTAALKGASDIEFAGNVYYSYSGASNFIWGSTEYKSLSSWRSTGQEKFNGKAVGTYTNPQLVSPGNAAPLASLTNIAQASDYALESGSPVVSSGISLDSFFTIASPLYGTSDTKTVPGAIEDLASAT
jgi:hypothetical protein